MKNLYFILIALTSIIFILRTFRLAQIKQSDTETIEQEKDFKFEAPKDWYLDSTMTERRHIYYETQSKMK